MFKIVLVATILIMGQPVTATFETPKGSYYDTLAACEEEKLEVKMKPDWTLVSSDCVPVNEVDAQ